MDIFILTLIAWIIFFVIGYMILKTLLKAIFFAGIIFVVLAIIISAMLLYDIRDIQNNFQKSPKLMLIESNSEVSSAFISGESASIVNAADLDVLTGKLKTKEYKSMLGQNYKLIIYSLPLIQGMDNFSLEIAKTSFDRDEIVKIMQNEGKAKYWSDKLYIPDYHQLRAAIFSELIARKLTGPSNLLVFIDGLKSGGIIVYPETIYFKIIKLVPTYLIKDRIKAIS